MEHQQQNNNSKKFLWVEKYRPQNFDQHELVLPESIRDLLTSITDQIPNMIFHGPPGTGKSSAGFILGKRIGADTIIINGSSERNIDTLRSTIREFASTVTLDPDSPHKLVIIEEADYTNQQSFQPALRRVIEEYSDNCRFIFTCNYLHKIIEPLRSRTIQVDFTISAEEKVKHMADCFARACSILDKEGVIYDQNTIANLVFRRYPDIRQLVNVLQELSQRYNNNIPEDINDQSNETDNINELVDILSDSIIGDNQKFDQIRKWVVNNAIEPARLFTLLYNQLYEKIDDKSNIPGIVLVLADYQYKSAFAADQELNTTAALVEVASQIE